MEEKRGFKFKLWPLLLSAALGTAAAWIWSQTPRKEPPAPAGAIEIDAGQVPAEAQAPLPPPEVKIEIPEQAPPPPPEEPKTAIEPGTTVESGSVPPAIEESPPSGGKLRFREIWAYLMPGEERLWLDSAPITDLGLFDFSLDPTGRLSGRANRTALERARGLGIRAHLVVASSGNKSLLHFALSPRYGVREALLEEIARLPREYLADGVQLDFEGPRLEERGDLLSFIRELRSKLPPGVRLSLAIPAKTADSDGPYRYADLAGAADRLFIMVYDEHWKGGPPGAISDLAWHERVLACAGALLPREKVVVGLPFYGRVWQREEVAKALKHPQTMELARKTSAEVRRDSKKSHSFTFRTEVTAECWFEDAASLRAKLESARARGFPNVGFWRLGQEDPGIWDILEIEREER